jgi:hypothetical protein
MTIDAKTYNATTAQITALTQSNLEAAGEMEQTRTTYFRALIGTTQAELKGTKDITPEMQLVSLNLVHKRFYAAVLAAVTTADIASSERLRAEEKTRRALERNKRSNFARVAYGTIKRWVKSGGHDLMTLRPPNVTQGQLRAETPARAVIVRKLTPEAAKARVDTWVENVLNATRAIADSDPLQARAVLDDALQRIAKELFGGAVQTTTDPATAMKEHRPLRAANGVFWPTDSQVIRRQRMKAAA